MPIARILPPEHVPVSGIRSGGKYYSFTQSISFPPTILIQHNPLSQLRGAAGEDVEHSCFGDWPRPHVALIGCGFRATAGDSGAGVCFKRGESRATSGQNVGKLARNVRFRLRSGGGWSAGGLCRNGWFRLRTCAGRCIGWLGSNGRFGFRRSADRRAGLLVCSGGFRWLCHDNLLEKWFMVEKSRRIDAGCRKKASKASESQRNPKKRLWRKSLKQGDVQLDNWMGETVRLFDGYRLGTACRLQPSMGMA